ncbi:hypothetical protein H5410_057865 [Solanum commersonii]|uniref:Uncharacterized protein n=1 Tax=Solanum commersonii TaxID=4109 RepID=A0A9J5WP28_SOLCO|nr:hypothetical protein H5410_057865 [Solanum commersonii]
MCSCALCSTCVAHPKVSVHKNITPNDPPPRKKAKGVVISELGHNPHPTQCKSTCVSGKGKKKVIDSK